MQRSIFALAAASALIACSANTDKGHANAGLIEHDTWLYHPSKGSRLFGAGERHPGDSWSDEPELPPVTDLRKGESEAQWGEKLNKALNDLEDQRKTFDASWADLTEENKRLEGQNADLSEQLGKAQADLDAATGEIAALKAQIAKFDGDGDGKPGGRAAKA